MNDEGSRVMQENQKIFSPLDAEGMCEAAIRAIIYRESVKIIQRDLKILGISQSVLAAKVGVDRAYLSRILSMKVYSPDKVSKIREYLDVRLFEKCRS